MMRSSPAAASNSEAVRSSGDRFDGTSTATGRNSPSATASAPCGYGIRETPSCPTRFQDEALVVMEGRYLPRQRLFEADIIFAKCPSKYEGQSYEGHVEAMGEAVRP